MSEQRLTQTLIHDTAHWQLVMEVDDGSLRVAALPPTDSERPVCVALTLPSAPGGHLKALEECVYDNPLLLEDFKGVSAYVDSRTFAFVPSALLELTAPETALAGMEADLDGSTVLTDSALPGISLVYALPTDLLTFLRRTFFNIGVHHRLAPIVKEAMAATVQAPCIRAVTEGGRLDVVATSGGVFAGANTFTFSTVADAAYYTLAFSRVLAPEGAKILVAGDDNAPETAAMLSRNGAEATLAPTPSAIMRLGREAAAMPQAIRSLLSCES